ncbi:MAG: L-threonylcarbamoyladenylate synthase [Myxococcota bacterium]
MRIAMEPNYKRLRVDTEFPEPRLIARAVAMLAKGGVITYPTDTNYGIGCGIDHSDAIDRIYRLRNLDKEHLLSFICPDLSDIARYALVENEAYRIMKRYLPGPYTFILRATPEVPRIFQSKRKTVGIRVPNHPVTLALARIYGKPIVSTSTHLGDRLLSNCEEINNQFGHGLDLMLDVGNIVSRDSSVVDLSGPYPVVKRVGAGDVSWIAV